MKIKHLIEALSAYDAEAEVHMLRAEDGEELPIMRVVQAQRGEPLLVRGEARAEQVLALLNEIVNEAQDDADRAAIVGARYVVSAYDVWVPDLVFVLNMDLGDNDAERIQAMLDRYAERRG